MHHRPSQNLNYAKLWAYSAALTGLLAAGLLAFGKLHPGGVIALRNILGYGHFTLAYIFAGRLVRRQIGSEGAMTAYVAGFLYIVALYAVAQRWWIDPGLNDLAVMIIFMIHHASNEVLFRLQSGNGYTAFEWTPRRISWVALAVWLVAVDRLIAVSHPWHGAARIVGGLWLAAWLAYGALWVLDDEVSALSAAGWIAIGAVVGWGLRNPWSEPLVATRDRFAWIVIAHYMMWYVFYTRKLLARTGEWGRALPAAISGGEALWKHLTSTPAGFLAMVLAGNAAIFAICFAADPVAYWVTTTTRLDFFQINTVAHILFGAWVPTLGKQSLSSGAGAERPSAEPAAQFA